MQNNDLFTQEEYGRFSDDSLEMMFGVSGQEIIQIEVNTLVSAEDHPFRVYYDDSMKELEQSIINEGILSPILVRAKGNIYEILSGHRRVYIAKKNGMDTIPAKVIEADDFKAREIMLESNIQRKDMLPSEKARVFKMSIELLSHQGQRDSDMQHSAKIVAQKYHIEPRTVYYYLDLNKLESDILEKIDMKVISLTDGRKLAKLSPKERQKLLVQLENGKKDVTSKEKAKRIIIKQNEFEKYFPENMSVQEMKKAIMEILEREGKKFVSNINV